MAESSAVVTTAHSASTGRLLWTRLASLLAIAPLGVWTVNHLWDQLSAYSGAEAWQQEVTSYKHPVARILTWIIVLLPLVLHTIWGIQRSLSSRPNNHHYGKYGNLKYLLQRVTALGLLGFIPAHLWLAFIQPRAVRGQPEAFADLAREMHHHGPTLIVYLLGTLAVAYHLANGLFGFAWTFGLTSGRKSFKWIDYVAIGSFLVMLGMAWGAIYALYRAGA